MLRKSLFIAICIIAFLYACGCGRSDRSETSAVQDGLATITQTELETNLYYLASKELDGRDTGSAGQELAAKFISDKFVEYGLTPGGDNGGWTQAFSYGGKNVIGIIGTSLNEVIVIGAHYDHLGTGYPGADDNASGTVAIIELAEALSKIKAELKRTVIIVAFSGEEMGLVGSKYYVSHPNAPLSNISYMINLDMVGYLRNKDLECLGAGSSSVMTKLIRSVAVSYSELIPSISSSAGGGSDHVYFVRNGIPSTFFHTGLHSNYHKPSDTPDKINYKGLTDISKLVFEVAYHLSVDEQLPVKTDLPTVRTDTIFRDHEAE